jgi:hypothetical protein
VAAERKEIIPLKPESQQKVWESLKKIYPILVQYEELNKKIANAAGYRREKAANILSSLTLDIKNNTALMNSLKQELPKIALKIQEASLNKAGRGYAL